MRYLTLTVAVLVGACVATPVHAQTADPQVMAPIHKFLDSFNKGDVPGAAAAHAATADLVIMDEVSPFVWHGAQAVQTWAGDLDRDAKKKGITDQKVTLGAATRVEVDGGSAYVVAPANYSFKEKGAAMRETAQMTFTLKKGADGWLIQGWTWTGPKARKASTPSK